tara:strand:- start:265 stop:534 length:270 start_codon:yes stop_codon:yes gene_type:complete
VELWDVTPYDALRRFAGSQPARQIGCSTLILSMKPSMTDLCLFEMGPLAAVPAKSIDSSFSMICWLVNLLKIVRTSGKSVGFKPKALSS